MTLQQSKSKHFRCSPFLEWFNQYGNSLKYLIILGVFFQKLWYILSFTVKYPLAWRNSPFTIAFPTFLVWQQFLQWKVTPNPHFCLDYKVNGWKRKYKKILETLVLKIHMRKQNLVIIRLGMSEKSHQNEVLLTCKWCDSNPWWFWFLVCKIQDCKKFQKVQHIFSETSDISVNFGIG